MGFTKWYFTSVVPGTIPSASTVEGAWDTKFGTASSPDFGGRFRDIGLYPFKTSGVRDGVNSDGLGENTATSPWRVIVDRATSLPLAAQTISGTVNMVCFAWETDAAADLFWRLHIYVMAPDLSVRGTLLSNYEESTNEWPTTSTAIALASAQALTSVTVQDGDRLVVERGYIARNASTTTYRGWLQRGTTNFSGTQLPDTTLGSTSSNTTVGYIEFSNAINIQAAPSNDECSTATVISSLPYNLSQNIETATVGTDPASAFTPSRYCTVFYKWTADITGRVAIDAGAITNVDGLSGFIPQIAVYTGACGTLTEIAGGKYGGVIFNATTGTTYTIMISSSNSSAGTASITISQYNPLSRDTSPRTAKFQEAFTPGNGTPMLHAFWERQPWSDHPQDPSYPLIRAAESVQVNTGEGPGGENILTSWTGPGPDEDGGFPDNDWQTLGIAYVGVGDLYPKPYSPTDSSELFGGYVNCHTGYATADVRFTTQSLLDTGFSQIFVLTQDHDDAWWLYIQIGNDEPDTFNVYTYVGMNNTRPGTTSHKVEPAWYTFKGSDLVDQWHTWTAVWQTGTASGSAIAADGWFQVLLDGVVIYSYEGLDITPNRFPHTEAEIGPTAAGLDADPDKYYYCNSIWLGYFGLPGETTNISFGTTGVTEVQAPPMQRASYVLFSKEIVEKQVETQLAHTYTQLLVTNPPASESPASLSLVTITGHIYDQLGNIKTSGRLYIQPVAPIQVSSTYLIGANTTTYDIPGTGDISLQLAPSNGTAYLVKFDPDPADTDTPISLKAGYFSNRWLVPASGPVDISTLID